MEVNNECKYLSKDVDMEHVEHYEIDGAQVHVYYSNSENPDFQEKMETMLTECMWFGLKERNYKFA